MSHPQMNTFSGVDLPDLVELKLPSAVSLFPDTLAWKLLLVVIVLTIVTVCMVRYRRYQRRLWRREAHALAIAAKQSARADDWFVLIKRVLRLYLPAEQLSAFNEQQLLAQLPELPDRVHRAMVKNHYRREGTLPEAENGLLAGAVHRWLKELPDV